MSYAFAFSIAASGFAGSASSAASTGMRALDQAASGGEVALHVDAHRIGEHAAVDLEHEAALAGKRPADARGRPAARASRRPGCKDRIAPTRTTARCDKPRSRPRRCGRRPRPGPARGASFPAAPSPCGPGKRTASPAAKIFGSEVRHCASTMMPSWVARPAAVASVSSGFTPVPTTTDAGRKFFAGRWFRTSTRSLACCTRVIEVPSRMSTPCWRCSSNTKAPISSSHTRARMRGAISSTVTLIPELRGRSRRFKADKSGADHDQFAGSAQRRRECARVGLGAQIIHVRRTHRQHRQLAHHAPGREHERVVGKAPAGFG